MAETLSYDNSSDSEVLTEEGSNEAPVEVSDTMAQYLTAIGKDAKRSKK